MHVLMYELELGELSIKPNVYMRVECTEHILHVDTPGIS